MWKRKIGIKDNDCSVIHIQKNIASNYIIKDNKERLRFKNVEKIILKGEK